MLCTQTCKQFYIPQKDLNQCTSSCDMYVLDGECVPLCPENMFVRVGNDLLCVSQQNCTDYLHVYPETSDYYGATECMVACQEDQWDIEIENR